MARAVRDVNAPLEAVAEEGVRVVQRAPFSHCVLGRTLFRNRLDAAPPRGWLLRCPNPRLDVQIRDEVRVVQRAPFSLRSAGPPRLTPQPPAGACYAAETLVWVHFLLPRTNFAVNANHRSRESA